MWTYDPTNNQIEVDNVAVSSTNDNVEMLKGITEGYDVSLSRETASAWYILCKKSRSNTNKDDPRTMDLVVSKGTYLPISLSAKVSVVTVTMRNVKYGVNESLVKFNPEDYPGATIVDKR
jgi:outer membrane lipoprotein-sorting protein